MFKLRYFFLILLLVNILVFVSWAAPYSSEKVNDIAQSIRLKKQGRYEEAIRVLQKWNESDSDPYVRQLIHELGEFDLSLNRGFSESSVDIDELLDEVISDQSVDQSVIDDFLHQIRLLIDSSQYIQAQNLISKLKDSIHVTPENLSSYQELLELERLYLLKYALDLVESDPTKSNALFEHYLKDPSEDPKLLTLFDQLRKYLEVSSVHEIPSDQQDLMEKGKSFFSTGEYGQAWDAFMELDKRDPGSSVVRAYQVEILRILQEDSALNRVKTREEMLGEVQRSWQRPMIYSQDSISFENERQTNPLIDKIRSIKIPRVNFSNMELTAVVETLSELSVEFDDDPHPYSKGVNIVPLFDPNTRSNPKVSISLRNLSLEKILQFVTQQVNFQFDIVDEAIVVQPTDGPDGVANLITEFYPVSRATVIRLTGSVNRGRSSLFANNPFDAKDHSDEQDPVHEEETAMKGFFQRAGVEFDGIRGASLAFDGTQLIVTQTSRNLERMRNILRRYEKTRQVEIEAKFLEVQQSDLDELGVQWSLQANGKQMFDVDGNPILSNTGDPVMRYDTNASTEGALRSLANVFSKSHASQGIQVTSPTIVGGKMHSPTNAPDIPAALNFAESLVGGVLSKVGVLGQSQLGVVIRALSRKEGSDLMSAPRLTVLSGKTANITVAQELRYPESYGDIEAEVSRGTSSSSDSRGGSGTVAITAGTPQDFVVRNIGVEMEVTPTVEDNDNISLLLEPKVTEFEGFVEYGGPSIAISGDLTATVPSGFYQPIFSTRSVRTEVTIYDGATVVIGGLTREEVKLVDDKVPLLGDIPFLGKLFRSEGETTRKKNLLIFVTANLIGPGGGPIKQEFPEMEPNSMFQNPSMLTPGGDVNRVVRQAE